MSSTTNIFQTITQTMRPPFLVLTPICILLGVAVATTTSHSTIAWQQVAIIVLGGLLAHISVNMFNEYFDFQSGLDSATKRTPFSGGSGGLPANPGAARAVLIGAIFSFVITALIGLYFVFTSGWAVMPLGILGLFIILTYTPWINKSPLMCLLAPGLGFGTLMVLSTTLILTGSLSTTALLASMLPFFVVNNLLLLNQYPDTEVDKYFGRNHGPIAWGTDITSWIYLCFVLLASITIVLAVIQGYFPALSLITLIPFILSIVIWRGAQNLGTQISQKTQLLGLNVLVTLSAPLLLAISLFLT